MAIRLILGVRPLATGFWPVASDQWPEACKELNWTKIYHTTCVTFLGDMILGVAFI
jgi:hypothetical protein